MKPIRALLVPAFLAAALAASARPITYTISAVASGTFDGGSFTNALLTFTAMGDTSAVSGGGVPTNVVAATATVAGLGTDALTGGLYVFSNHSADVGGLAPNANLGDVLDTTNAAIATYSLDAPLAPVSGASLSSGSTYGTTRGSLTIQSAGNSTFGAFYTPTPEPSAFAPLTLGAIAFVKRRKRA